jgi:hypothetical protein
MTPADWFTPYRKTWLDEVDLDLAAAGVVLIPNTRYLVAGGKEGLLYVLDRDHLGKFDDSVRFDASKVMLIDPSQVVDSTHPPIPLTSAETGFPRTGYGSVGLFLTPGKSSRFAPTSWWS